MLHSSVSISWIPWCVKYIYANIFDIGETCYGA